MTECRVQLPQQPTASAFRATFESLAAKQLAHHAHKPAKMRIERETRSIVIEIREEEQDG